MEHAKGDHYPHKNSQLLSHRGAGAEISENKVPFCGYQDFLLLLGMPKMLHGSRLL